MAQSVLAIDALGIFRLGKRLEKGATQFHLKLAVEADLAAHEIGDAAVAQLRAVTPHNTGRLAQSTRADVRMLVGPTRIAAEISLSQPATSENGFEYAPVVIHGRGPVFARPGSALRTPWGPRKSVKGAAANPYPDEAEPRIALQTTEMLHARGRKAIEEVTRSL